MKSDRMIPERLVKYQKMQNYFMEDEEGEDPPNIGKDAVSMSQKEDKKQGTPNYIKLDTKIVGLNIKSQTIYIIFTMIINCIRRAWVDHILLCMF